MRRCASPRGVLCVCLGREDPGVNDQRSHRTEMDRRESRLESNRVRRYSRHSVALAANLAARQLHLQCRL